MVFPATALLKGDIESDPQLVEFLENSDNHTSTEFRSFLEQKFEVDFWPDQFFCNNDGTTNEDAFVMIVFHNDKLYRAIDYKGYSQKFIDFFTSPEI